MSVPAAGVVPVDAPALGADHLVAGTSKYLLGLGGLAFLYARHPGTEDLPPSLTGWMGRVAPMSFDPTRLDFPAEARRFETGTPPLAAVYAADASLRLLLALRPEEVHTHVLHLARRAHARAASDLAAPSAAGAMRTLPRPRSGHVDARLHAPLAGPELLVDLVVVAAVLQKRTTGDFGARNADAHTGSQ